MNIIKLWHVVPPSATVKKWARLRWVWFIYRLQDIMHNNHEANENYSLFVTVCLVFYIMQICSNTMLWGSQVDLIQGNYFQANVMFHLDHVRVGERMDE